MTDLLLKLFEIGLNASILTLAVFLLRLLFRKAPKTLHCALWGLVALRLLLPFTIESPFSLQPESAAVQTTVTRALAVAESYLPDAPKASPDATTRAWTTAVPQGNGANAALPDLPPAENTGFLTSMALPTLFCLIWGSGVAVLLLYAAFSLLRLKRQIAASLQEGAGVYRADDLSTPFLLGIIHPKIYLPSGLSDQDKPYVLAHEQAHIRRRDSLWKALAFLLLCVYWFHPLLWFAYAAFNRDLELACDETVLRGFSPADRAAYAEALLHCSSRRTGPTLSPLAFGEVGVKSRVKRALSYQKPAVWATALSLPVAAAAAVCLLTTSANRDTLPAARDLDDAIHTALMEDNEEKQWMGEYQTEAHIVLGTKEKKDRVTAYVLHEYASFGFVNGCFMEQGGGIVPAALTFSKTDAGYRLQKIAYAEDGADFAPSVKRLFPFPYRLRLQALLKTDNKELWEEVKNNAAAYLASIGRTEKVVTYGEIPHILFTDVGMPVDVSNRGLPMALAWYPTEIGTEERIENGVRIVYSTAYDEERQTLVFSKFSADAPDAILESFVMDIKTGDLHAVRAGE